MSLSFNRKQVDHDLFLEKGFRIDNRRPPSVFFDVSKSFAIFVYFSRAENPLRGCRGQFFSPEKGPQPNVSGAPRRIYPGAGLVPPVRRHYTPQVQHGATEAHHFARCCA